MNVSTKPASSPAPGEDLECVYSIGGKKMLPDTVTEAALGFKAYNLARMAALGLNVPPAFVIGTGFCARPQEAGPELWRLALAELEAFTGLRLGDARRPLLLSVRSGAAVSMPGMMDTLLNIGLTDATIPGLIRLTGHPRLAWDAYRRLIANYGEVVAGIDAAHFEADLAGDIPARDRFTFPAKRGDPTPRSDQCRFPVLGKRQSGGLSQSSWSVA
jgi:phosphoenolpyruvate synthase/pyruvate phosphate dikinase